MSSPKSPGIVAGYLAEANLAEEQDAVPGARHSLGGFDGEEGLARPCPAVDEDARGVVEDDALLLGELVELRADVVDDGVGGGDEVEVELVGAAVVGFAFDHVEGETEEEVFAGGSYFEGVGVVVCGLAVAAAVGGVVACGVAADGLYRGLVRLRACA